MTEDKKSRRVQALCILCLVLLCVVWLCYGLNVDEAHFWGSFLVFILPAGICARLADKCHRGEWSDFAESVSRHPWRFAASIAATTIGLALLASAVFTFIVCIFAYAFLHVKFSN